MAVTSPRVAALVLNWRLPDMTLQCLQDLRACSYPALDVLVVDNGSGDGSAERLAAAAGDADVLAFERNLGYCAAMNRGLAWARAKGCDLALFLNNDVRLPPDFLAPLVAAIQTDRNIAGVGPTILQTDGTTWCQGGSLAFHPNMLRLRGLHRSPAPTSAGPEHVDFLPGACVLYRLDDLAAVGDLDESYFMYWEDVEIAWRLRQHGKKIIWLPWSRVTHLSSASSGGGRSPMRKYMSGLNSVRYLRAHGTLRQWAAFAVFEVVLWPFTWLGGTGWRAMLAKGRGILDGLRDRRVTVEDVARFR